MAEATTDEQGLDFSTEQVLETESSLQPGNEYNPRPKEDEARRYIAYALIGLLWVVVVSTFILIAFGMLRLEDIKELAVILGPTVTLVSAATGFYYGTKSNSAGT